MTNDELIKMIEYQLRLIKEAVQLIEIHLKQLKN